MISDSKLDSLKIESEIHSGQEIYADNICSVNSCELHVYGHIGVLFMDTMYIEKGNNVKINEYGYIDLIKIPQKYSLLSSSDSLFQNSNGTNGRYIRAYYYGEKNISYVGVFVGGGSFYDKQVLGSYATIVLNLTEQ